MRFRKLADTSSGERVKRYDPFSGAAYLADPETWDVKDESTWVESPWPLAGVAFEGEAPDKDSISMAFVSKAQAEGWVSLEGERVVHRPGGPPEAPWRVTHSFVQADAIVFHLFDGDVRYRVVENPDKWPDEKNHRDEGFGGEVRWYYEIEREAE